MSFVGYTHQDWTGCQRMKRDVEKQKTAWLAALWVLPNFIGLLWTSSGLTIGAAARLELTQIPPLPPQDSGV
jgi:hypothetical protein